MVKKVFISQPMGNKTDIEIHNERSAIEKLIYQNFPSCEIIDTLLEDSDVPECKHRPLMFLAKSLELLADADVAFFAPGWENARGCVIEHEAAKRYEIDIYEMKDADIKFLKMI